MGSHSERNPTLTFILISPFDETANNCDNETQWAGDVRTRYFACGGLEYGHYWIISTAPLPERAI